MALFPLKVAKFVYEGKSVKVFLTEGKRELVVKGEDEGAALKAFRKALKSGEFLGKPYQFAALIPGVAGALSMHYMVKAEADLGALVNPPEPKVDTSTEDEDEVAGLIDEG